MLRIVLRPVLLLVIAAHLAPAQALMVAVPEDSARRHLVARRATAPLVLDGRLDEPDWQRAPVASQFVQVRPDYRLSTPYPSEIRVLFDDEHLYFGAFHRDSAGAALRMPDLRRDFGPQESDVFGITMGPMGDRRTVYQLQVTPLGSQADVQAFDGGASFSFSWDAMWRVRTTRSDSGWVAEVAVPWTSLRYAPGLGSWDINFVRNTRRALHWSAWVPYPRQFSSWRLTYSGVLDSIAPPPPRANLRSRLYGLSETQRDRTPGAFSGTVGSFGGEMIWAPSANSLVEGTINTDFAQADVDRQVVNLTRFSVFFPERRQFFLENADLLAVGGQNAGGMGVAPNPFVVQPFFSRRIGLGADGSPRPVDGGVRYGYRTGRTAAGALVMRQSGIGADRMDAATFGVARASRFVGRSTRFGALAAYRTDEDDVAGGGANLVTAVDALTRVGEQTQLTAMASTSTVDQRTGVAATWSLGRSTATTNFGLSGAYVSADYAPSTGFVSRPNTIMTGPFANLTLQPAWRPADLVWIKPEVQLLLFHDPGTRQLQEGSAQLSTEFLGRSGATLRFSARHDLQRPTGNVTLLPGVTVAPGSYAASRAGIEFATDQSARFAASTFVSGGGLFDGRQDQATLAARWSPSPYLSVGASYEINWLTSLGAADTSLVTHLAGPELRFFLNPRVQWSAFYQHNSVLQRATLNARFSWEFAPLSYLYVVYNDRQAVLDGTTPRAQGLIVKLSWLRQL